MGQPVLHWHMNETHARYCPGCGCRVKEVTFIYCNFDEEHIALRVFVDHEKKCRDEEERGVCGFTVLVNIHDLSAVACVY